MKLIKESQLYTSYNKIIFGKVLQLNYMSNLNTIKINKLVKDSFWAIFGTAIGKGSVFFAGIFIARFLGKISYGEYAMLKNTFISISLITLFGLGYLLTHFAENKNNPLFDYKLV